MIHKTHHQAPPTASSSSSSSHVAAASSGQSQGYDDGQGVQTTAHGNPRSSQGSISHIYDYDVPLTCAGCGKASTSVKKQQCGHVLCDVCQLMVGRCSQCPTAIGAGTAGAGGVTGTRYRLLTVRDDIGIGSQRPSRRDTDESSLYGRIRLLPAPRRENSDDKATAAAAPVADHCTMCKCIITDSEKLACGHVFCRPCIQKSFAQSPDKCPCCGCICGPLKGNQPPGTMISSRLYPALHGYEGYYTIEITYSFDSGMQQEGHPHPDTPYDGTKRVAYLPDTSEGRSVYKLLEQAFIAGLTFTIGQSVTTGQGDVITWNGIPHKTQMIGKWYGYPDPTYLQRVREELAAKGMK